MIEKVNSVRTKLPEVNFSGRKREEQKNYDDKSNVLMTSLIVAAAVTIGVILAVKHMQAKRMTGVGEKIIQRPRMFGEKDIQELAQYWVDEGKLDYGDKVAIVPQSVLQHIAESDKEHANILKGMKMSGNGFGITVMKSDNNFDFETLRYYDPECITVLKMVDAIKNDRIYCCEVG